MKILHRLISKAMQNITTKPPHRKGRGIENEICVSIKKVEIFLPRSGSMNVAVSFKARFVSRV
jgi:hypothetical protein